MPDIMMCEGGSCPKKKKCYRHMVTPSEFRQSYFAEIPYDKEAGKCDNFWPFIRSSKKITK